MCEVSLRSERVGVTLKLWSFIREVLVHISSKTPAIMTEVIDGYSQLPPHPHPGKYRDGTSVTPRPFPSRHFPIHHS
jgi:hypothetical protein